MQTIKCFEVLGNTDTTEGRTPKKVVAYFSTREEAIKYVKSPAYRKWCVMGVQCNDDIVYNISEVTLTILDTASEIEQAEREQIKIRALAKLTKEERAALGL